MRRGRAENVVAPRGPTRPAPRYVVGNTWVYRGRQIDLREDARGRWEAQWDILPGTEPVPGAASSGQTDASSPDAQGALQVARFYIDIFERVRERGLPHEGGTGDVLYDAFVAVRDAVNWVADVERRAPDRSNVARRIEEQRRENHHESKIFMKLPLPERVELIDDVLQVAVTHGGRWPAWRTNPDVPGAGRRIFAEVVGGTICLVRAVCGSREIGRLTAERLKPDALRPGCARALAKVQRERRAPLHPWVVVRVHVLGPHRGHAVGLDLYLGAARAISPHGGALVAAACEDGPGWTSRDAMRVWQSDRLRDYLHIQGSPRSGFVGALRSPSADNPRSALLAW